MDYKKELQLLPGTKKRLGIKIPGENRFLYIGSAILGAVLVSMIYLGRYETSLRKELGAVDSQLAALEQKRNKKEEAELRLTKDRLALISNLIRDHSYWSEGFVWLENMLQSDTQIENVTIIPQSGGTKLLISAFATSYTVIARQLATFISDDRVLDIRVGKMTYSAEGVVEFDMELTIDSAKIIRK